MGAAFLYPSIPDPFNCTSLTRPAHPILGQLIYETDTFLDRRWDGTRWEILRWHGDTRTSHSALPGADATWANAVIGHNIETNYSGWTTVNLPGSAFDKASTTGGPLFDYVNAPGQTFRCNEKGRVRVVAYGSSDLGAAGRSSMTLLAPYNGAISTMPDTRHRPIGYAGSGYLEQIIEATIQVQPGDIIGYRVFQYNTASASVTYQSIQQVQYI